MYQVSKKFSSQLEWQPTLENSNHLVKSEKFTPIILGGMGGSHLGAGILKVCKPGIDIYVHRSYGLPPFSEKFLERGLCVASSYSGNTEETLSFYNEAQKKSLKIGVITSGGKLLDLAIKNNNPYIKLPDGIQPRDALGYFSKALMIFVGDSLLQDGVQAFIKNPVQLFSSEDVLNITKSLSNKIPLIYSSIKNLPLSYIWKIKFNETAKTPAFCNVFPELNHNEMEGFDNNLVISNLTSSFVFIFLRDIDDHSRIIKRMDVLQEILQSKGLVVQNIMLSNKSPWHTIAHSIELGDVVALSLAKEYGVDPEKVNLIEEFKKKIN